MACSHGKHAPPAHKCPKGSKVGAFFVSEVDVQFTLCVKFPGGPRLCAQAQSAKANKVKLNPVTTDKLGRHKLTWKLPDGTKIVRYFRLIRD